MSAPGTVVLSTKWLLATPRFARAQKATPEQAQASLREASHPQAQRPICWQKEQAALGPSWLLAYPRSALLQKKTSGP